MGRHADQELDEEALDAEAARQSRIADGLLASTSGGGGGAAAGRGGRSAGRGGSGTGAGRGGASGGRGVAGCVSSGIGLVVARFDPSASASTAKGSRPRGVAPSDEDEKHSSLRKREREEDVSATKVTIKSSFARIFAGGPQRQASDLPVKDDEGMEELPAAPPPHEQGDEAGGLSWLGSVGGADQDEEEEEDPAGLEKELDWLASVGGRAPAASAAAATSAVLLERPERADAGAETVLSEKAKAIEGKALPIPPFWRTEPLEKLEKQLARARPMLRLRLKRMAKDARRTEERRGKVRARYAPVGHL